MQGEGRVCRPWAFLAVLRPADDALRPAGGVGGPGLTGLPAPQPGSPVYSSKCEDCVCTNRTDGGSRLNVISCTHVHCEDSCSPVSRPPRPAPARLLAPLPPVPTERACPAGL